MKKRIQHKIVALVGLLSFLYLCNPGLGLFEFIPDGIPIIGNIDELSATYLLYSSLSYFGFDIRSPFKKK